MRSVLAIAAVAGCVSTRTIHVRDQNALVLTPAAPTGAATALPAGSVSLALGGSWTDAQVRAHDGVGNRALPVSGLVRGAVAASDALEVVASGSLASPEIALPGLSRRIPGRSGEFGEGELGLRMFADLGPTRVQWAWEVDCGAEGSFLVAHDRIVDQHQGDEGGWVTDDEQERTFRELRVHPRARLGTAFRFPFAGAWLTGGAAVQSWPLYWDHRVEVDTTNGGTTTRNGRIDPGSRLVAVFSPTVGAELPLGATSIELQTWANLGVAGVGTVPYGAAVAIERAVSTRARK